MKNIMFGEYNFKKDVKKGEYLESIVYKMISNRCKDVYKISFNNDYKYDIVVLFNDMTFCTIEVKYDMMSAKTGNIAIETMCRGKNSGINSSTADYFIYGIIIKDNLKIFIIRREKLIDIINKNKFKTVYGGDCVMGNPSTKMIIMPVEQFIENAIDITNRKNFVFGIRKKYV